MIIQNSASWEVEDSLRKWSVADWRSESYCLLAGIMLTLDIENANFWSWAIFAFFLQHEDGNERCASTKRFRWIGWSFRRFRFGQSITYKQAAYQPKWEPQSRWSTSGLLCPYNRKTSVFYLRVKEATMHESVNKQNEEIMISRKKTTIKRDQDHFETACSKMRHLQQAGQCCHFESDKRLCNLKCWRCKYSWIKNALILLRLFADFVKYLIILFCN